jgi:D-alanyl-D-alanine carboxypeptidase
VNKHKHYHIDYGVRKANRLRPLLISVSCLSIVGLGVFSVFSTKAAPKTVEGSKGALNQAAQTPASAVQAKLSVPMKWPVYGHSAYGVPKANLIAASDDNAQPVPIASLAKVITALAVLKEKPLQTGEQGPMITLNEQDVALYGEYVRKNGAVVPVEAGEQISQYQALQAMLMVSANNLSDSLVQRTFGSAGAYVTYANKMLKDLGLNKTTVADASGYSPKTVSTAEDMAKLGYLYMQNPVLRQIAMQDQATIPVAGRIQNYNSFTNEDGVVGIKVGDTDEAGKCFLAVNIRQSSGSGSGSGSGEELSIAVVLGADSLRVAAKDAHSLLKAGNKGYDQLAKSP